eukprot:6174228-Pleurochrysis_carterae.AAC.1
MNNPARALTPCRSTVEQLYRYLAPSLDSFVSSSGRGARMLAQLRAPRVRLPSTHDAGLRGGAALWRRRAVGDGGGRR